MTECKPDPPQAEQSALSFAIHAFHHEQVDRAPDRSLPSHIQNNATQDIPTSSSPSEANGKATGRRNSIHREVLSEQEPEFIIAQVDLDRPRAQHDARAKLSGSTVTTMRRMQVQAMLSRCQLLQATILSLDCRQKSHKTAAEIQTHGETMEQLARRALLMAEGVRDSDLLAKSEHWAGRARAGIGGQDEAVNHPSRDNGYDQDLTYVVTAEGLQGDNKSLSKITPCSAGKRLCGEAVPPPRQAEIPKQNCLGPRRDSLASEQLLTVRDELDAIFECLHYEDGYGDLLDHLEDEIFDPQGILSQLS